MGCTHSVCACVGLYKKLERDAGLEVPMSSCLQQRRMGSRGPFRCRMSVEAGYWRDPYCTYVHVSTKRFLSWWTGEGNWRRPLVPSAFA